MLLRGRILCRAANQPRRQVGYRGLESADVEQFNVHDKHKQISPAAACLAMQFIWTGWKPQKANAEIIVWKQILV